ncbi:MAG TPA: DUF4157 domain-containing protein [Kofleriaceae bacterium]|nr:DUF4157 domain-containing protein [Kofleriaceae bacterium]
MSHRLFRDSDDGARGPWGGGGGGVAPGKKSLTQSLVARRARDDNGVAADADQAVDRAAGGSGEPLRADVRDRFESSLGADLSGVRVHTGGASAEATAAVGAQAYTVGNDIHFGAGTYQPDDPFGLHLLAHEVAHTQQQSGGAPHRQNKLEVTAPGDTAEVEADSAADAMVAGRPAAISGSRATVARGGGPSYSRGERSDDERGGGALTSAQFEQECELKKVAAYLELGEVAMSLHEAAARAAVRRETGENVSSKEKSTLTQTIKELTSTAKQVAGLADAVNTIKGGRWGAQLESVKGGLGKAGDVLDTLEAVRAIADTAPLEKLKKDPSEANAEAWAIAAASKFDVASKLVDKLPIEVGFIKDYFKGVLGAPSAYVKVFLSIMKRRYDGIDKEADVSKGGESYGPWKGPSHRLGAEADNTHHDLYQYMLANMEIDGRDIQSCSYALARDLFSSKIVNDPELTTQTKARWLTHLGH